jgi:membrane dipeptidase
MVVDLHEDIADYFMMSGPTADVRPFDEDVPGRHVDIPKYTRVGMTLVLGSIFPLLGSLNKRKIAKMKQNYGTWSTSSALASPRDVAIEQVKIYYSLEEMYPTSIKIIRTKHDLDSLGKRTGLVLHLEGGEALGEPEDLRIFYNLGVRSVGLTWNYDNKYAASCMSKKDYGLTGEGEELVAEANKLGVMVDLSHTSARTSSETIDLSESSPFFSHSNSSTEEPTVRNISDDLIRKSTKRGGIVGLTFIRSCIGKPYSPARLAKHARRMLKIGSKSLPALGTDYLGIGSTPEGLDDISELKRFTKALKTAGISEEEIELITHGNAYSFISKYAENW